LLAIKVHHADLYPVHSQNFKLKVVRYNNLPFAVVFPSHLAKMPLPSTSLKRKFATRKQPVPPVVNRSGRHGGSNNNSKSSDNGQAVSHLMPSFNDLKLTHKLLSRQQLLPVKQQLEVSALA